MGRTVGALGDLCFILFLFVFIFSVLGMQLFDPTTTRISQNNNISDVIDYMATNASMGDFNTSFTKIGSQTTDSDSDLNRVVDSRDILDILPVISMSRWNFKDFGHSLMMVFRVMCGEWVEPMWDCMNVFGYHCMPFFLLVLVVGNLLVSGSYSLYP